MCYVVQQVWVGMAYAMTSGIEIGRVLTGEKSMHVSYMCVCVYGGRCFVLQEFNMDRLRMEAKNPCMLAICIYIHVHTCIRRQMFCFAGV